MCLNEMQDAHAVGLRTVIHHQEVAMAGALDDLRHATASSPGSLEARQHALQGVALARGRHMSEVYALKQKNLQVRQTGSMILGLPVMQSQESLSAVVCRCE